MKNILAAILVVASGSLMGCTAVQHVLNPFYSTPSEVASLGERSDAALRSDVQKGDNARAALNAMGTYQRAHDPQPANPVMQPAVVRLTWVPDHLNKNGDLVPAHFYYLKVKSEGWAVQDAFELESQLGSTSSASSMPFVYSGK